MSVIYNPNGYTLENKPDILCDSTKDLSHVAWLWVNKQEGETSGSPPPVYSAVKGRSAMLRDLFIAVVSIR